MNDFDGYKRMYKVFNDSDLITFLRFFRPLARAASPEAGLHVAVLNHILKERRLIAKLLAKNRPIAYIKHS